MMKENDFPNEGEIFTLEYNFRFNPSRLPLYDMQAVIGGWKFDGRDITGPQKRDFLLCQSSNKDSLAEVLVDLRTKGRVPEGQWIIPFLNTFPPPEEHDVSVGFADPSWIHPGFEHGVVPSKPGASPHRCFPYLYGNKVKWEFRFLSESCRLGHWLWLLEK